MFLSFLCSVLTLMIVSNMYRAETDECLIYLQVKIDKYNSSVLLLLNLYRANESGQQLFFSPYDQIRLFSTLRYIKIQMISLVSFSVLLLITQIMNQVKFYV